MASCEYQDRADNTPDCPLGFGLEVSDSEFISLTEAKDLIPPHSPEAQEAYVASDCIVDTDH